MIDVRRLVDDASRVATTAITIPTSAGVRRGRPVWPEEEARAFACLQDRLFGRFEPPPSLHRYVLLERLGSGGGGIVYTAYDPQLDRKVAIKLLRGLADERAQLRLVREAQALAKLAHPNVVTVFDVGTYDPASSEGDGRALSGMLASDPVVFIVMEYVDGPTLADWLRSRSSRRGRRWQRDVLDQFLAAGRGLIAAHALGIVHRDFKPQNVVIGGDGRARVLDFGLSRVVASPIESATGSECVVALPRETDAHDLVSLTDAGMVVGTPAYMAPEQHLGAAVDARADQFAFCVALFEALHGQRPFVGASLGELVRAKQEGAVRPTASALPGRIDRALARGLAPDPDARHDDLTALLAELEPRRGRAWASFSAALVVVVALLAFAWLGDSRRDALHTCEAARNELASVWTSARRDEVTQAFARSGNPHAERSLVDALAGIDRWGDAWASARTEACIAASTTRADGELMRRRSVCLDHALGGARTTIELLAAADRKTVAWSRDIVSSLPDIMRCADDELLASEAIPPDAGSVHAVGRVASDIVALRMHLLTGEERRAVVIGRAAVQEADASGHPPTRIRARYALAWAQSRTGDLAGAEQSLREGWMLAESGRLDDLQIRGVLDLSGVLRQRGRTSEADAMLETAVAKASRAPESAGLASDLAVQRGHSQLDAGRVDLAIASLEEALAAREVLFGREHVAIAWTSLDLARAHAIARAPSEVRRWLDRAVTVLATHRPMTLAHGELLDAEARLALLEARPADAVAAWATLDVLGETGVLGDPVLRARARNGLAEAWLALDRVESARDAIAEQPDRCRRSLGPMHHACIDAFDIRGRVERAGGDVERADADAHTVATLLDARR